MLSIVVFDCYLMVNKVEYKTAHTVNIVDNLITRCIISKFRYFKKTKFHYLKQVVNLSATCFHVEVEQFLACFALSGFVSDSWAFLFRQTTALVSGE